MRYELAILYRPLGGGAVVMAAVTDRRLLASVAAQALSEAERAAEAVGRDDAILGEMQRLEAQRLRGVLEPLLPVCAAESAQVM